MPLEEPPREDGWDQAKTRCEAVLDGVKAAAEGGLEDAEGISSALEGVGVQLLDFFVELHEGGLKALKAKFGITHDHDSQKHQAEQPHIPHVSSLTLKDISAAEMQFCRCSVVGQVIICGLKQGLAALPFGAPVGAVIGVIFARAAQAAHNSIVAQGLLSYLEDVDLHLARLLAASIRGHIDHLDDLLQRLGKQLDEAARLMFAYSGRGFLVRSLLSTYDRDHFADVEAGIKAIMQGIITEHVLHQIEGHEPLLKRDWVPNEPLPKGDSALKELCKVAGEPHEGGWDEERVQALLSKLHKNPQLLRGVLQKSTTLADNIIAFELQNLERRMSVVEVKVEDLHVKVTGLEHTLAAYMAAAVYDQRQGPVSLHGYIKDFWDTAFKEERLKAGVETITVPCPDVMKKLRAWIEDKMGDEGKIELQLFDEVLTKDILAGPGLSFTVANGCVSGPFLDRVFARELDENADGMVTPDELLAVQLKAEEYAKHKFKDKADWILFNWLKLLNAIFMGFDRGSFLQLVSKQQQQQQQQQMQNLEDRLHVKAIIQSYKINSLLSEYVQGTRLWLYDDVNAWLDVATARGRRPESSRMFLLLMKPGMGKSVFSAVIHTHLMARTEEKRHVEMVKHFFKVDCHYTVDLPAACFGVVEALASAHSLVMCKWEEPVCGMHT